MADFVEDKQQILEEERVRAFLDELTMLARKYGIEVSSEGNVDVPSLRNIRAVDANQGRYEIFWSTVFADSPVERGPIDFQFVSKAELENIIDLEDI